VSILDPHPGDPGAVQFDDLANALLEQGEMVSPAELHGCLCGMLGGGFAGGESDILQELEQTLDASLHGELADEVIGLHHAARVCIEDGNFDLQPLLPDDDLELPQRIAAMASWCRGFLSGYAQARVKADARGAAVAPDSAEALRDFAAIAQAGLDSEDEAQTDDEAERQYAELHEYLRVAAMNVLMDGGVGSGDTPGA
jgi:uncharacterized protein YgfB (UPF0149 family)